MTDLNPEVLARLGLTEDDFKPKPNEDKRRIQELETAMEALLNGETE